MANKKWIYMTQFGQKLIPRAYCPECKTWAIVIHNRLQCCDELINMENYDDVKVVYQNHNTKKRIPKAIKKKIKEKQGNRCIYCGIEIGKYYFRKGRYFQSKPHYDHFVPYTFGRNNNETNLYLSCNICNSIKHSKIFDTIEEARAYILAVRKNKGIENEEERNENSATTYYRVESDGSYEVPHCEENKVLLANSQTLGKGSIQAQSRKNERIEKITRPREKEKKLYKNHKGRMKIEPKGGAK